MGGGRKAGRGHEGSMTDCANGEKCRNGKCLGKSLGGSEATGRNLPKGRQATGGETGVLERAKVVRFEGGIEKSRELGGHAIASRSSKLPSA